MSNLLLRNGKILIAGYGGGLSASCDCCEDPPPKTCDDCCFGTQSGDIEVDDSVLVEIEATLPGMRFQAISPRPGDNGVRRYDSVSLSGQMPVRIYAVLVAGVGGGYCLRAADFFQGDFFLSDVTFTERPYIDILFQNRTALCILSCEFIFGATSTLTGNQEMIDLGEEGTVPYAIRPTSPSSFGAGWVLKAEVPLPSDPCLNQFPIPLYLDDITASTIAPTGVFHDRS